ncbi:disulfide bond formation protein B [Chthonobacter rhizosphaerae]|uniref:disulfide bond formation protein B n=1 Tax=Chthonobacter rhizosphaerae TaxID=2735553 RepID=UPI0015EEEF54|nr:disulfide bond formation protein B [Chthonobacter rhizosphaerae]
MAALSPRTPVPVLPLAAAFAVGLAAIAAAWGFQLIGGYVPCKLCYQQRIPYYVGLPLLLVAFLLRRRAPALARVAAGLGGLAFLVGAALGGYQAGAEWGFWPGPSDCGGGTGPTTNAGDLLSQMRATRLVSCTEASWRLLGLSFAGWNMVASGFVAVAALAGAVVKPAERA